MSTIKTIAFDLAMSLEFIFKNRCCFVLTTTKLTNDIAFSEIFQSHIIPPILIRMSVTISRIIIAAIKSNPVKINDTAKMVANEMPNENVASVQIVKYCS